MNRTFASIPRRCILCASLSLALFFAIAPHPAPAQQPAQLNDPANLAGERVSPPDLADTLPINHGALALEQLLRKLRTRASFMLIVAHPDDEDGGMLTYLSRGQGARVAMLTLTRGEGGQNLMSADFEDALGLIRTQELLAADRYMGVDQFFGTEVDFGFSKTKEEAFAKWTHERVLYDAVRAVRLYRPLVIASVFIGAPTDGHGHHQVSGEIAQEVFNAAGDPTVFPDQIAQGLAPWQPLKVYARVPFARIDAQGMYDYATSQYVPPRFENYVTEKVTDTVPKVNVVVPEGTPDPLLGGLTYVQFARQGLALQKTQIGQGVRTAPGGRADVSYHRYGSRVLDADGKPQPNDGSDDPAPEPSFFSGIDTTLPGIATLAPDAPPALGAVLQLIDMKIAEAQKQFDPSNLAATAEPLRIALQTLDTVISGTESSTLNQAEKANLLHELRIKRVQLNNALVLAHGITLEATLGKQSDSTKAIQTALLATDKFVSVTTKEANSSGDPIGFAGGSIVPLSAKFIRLDEGAVFKTGIASLNAEIDKPLAATRPYFSRKDIEQPYYDISDPALRNAPATPPSLVVEEDLVDKSVPLTLMATVQSSGMERQAAAVVPPISIAVSPSEGILTPNFMAANLDVVVRSNTRQSVGKLSLTGPSNWNVADTRTFSIANGNEEYRDRLSASPPQYVPHPLPTLPMGITAGATYSVGTIVTVDGTQYREGYRPVGYPGLVTTNYYTPATYKAVAVDVTTAPHLNIAYLPGTGDDVPSALSDLGVTPHMIALADLTPESLKQYDAVVLGVRPYEAHPELAAANPALLAYAQNGGIVIVQYVARELPASAAPYPLSLGSNEKVVDETAPVQLLTPNDPLLTWPNRITTADFDGWVEERGHGFMDTWDPHYLALLESHDPGQQPQRGGLLVAHTGKGAWIYLAYALYRQLPEGVPGPYRLFANLISAAKNPQFLAAAPAK